MIIDLLATLMTVGACAVTGIVFTIQRREHERAQQLADEERVAEEQDLYAAMASIHAYGLGGPEPRSVDTRDRLPI